MNKLYLLLLTLIISCSPRKIKTKDNNYNFIEIKISDFNLNQSTGNEYENWSFSDDYVIYTLKRNKKSTLKYKLTLETKNKISEYIYIINTKVKKAQYGFKPRIDFGTYKSFSLNILNSNNNYGKLHVYFVITNSCYLCKEITELIELLNSQIKNKKIPLVPQFQSNDTNEKCSEFYYKKIYKDTL